LRNLRSATSRVSPSKVKYLRYSSATTRLKSLLRKNYSDYLHNVSRLNHATLQYLKFVKSKKCNIIFVVPKLTRSTVQENVGVNYVYPPYETTSTILDWTVQFSYFSKL
jgi:hypothetical protein